MYKVDVSFAHEVARWAFVGAVGITFRDAHLSRDGRATGRDQWAVPYDAIERFLIELARHEGRCECIACGVPFESARAARGFVGLCDAPQCATITHTGGT